MTQLIVRSLLCAACTAAAWIYCSSAESAPGPSQKFVVAGVQVTDLGTLGGAQSSALDINDSGDIAGWAATAQGIQHAFRYSNGMMNDIGSAFGNARSDAAGINASGNVVGTMTDQFGTLGVVWWQSGSASWLRGQGNQETHGAAINDNDVVSGTVYWPGPGGDSRATMWRLGHPPVDFPNIDPAVANDINLSDVVVGHDGDRPLRWFWLRKGFLTHESPVPPPGSGYGAGDALAINDGGDVVGYYSRATGTTGSVTRAYLWDHVSTNSQEIGVLPGGSNSVARDINERRFIAGHADERIVKPPFDIVHEKAFLYHRDFGLYALPALPGTSWLGSCRAFALNEWNQFSWLIQVVGACDTPGGSRAVRWDVDVMRTLPIVGP